ncbi:uncharacterized protein B0P05DRAFT_587907 [Gilbertella persicaria]|uniref:uncharacterized protein n=1 Tax=Gilbertella persicaria TaxID=101096 RepID=UPI00221F6C9E|nr:uncharacterized protein B0P05DRAFT_587907 [Gilbertella persicaria]KAI8076601.1 hypothetical protein B0P05DRAFT_587907 [Gilbertella persicaria]
MSTKKESRPYIRNELLTELFGSKPEHVLHDMYELSNALSYKVIEGIADRLISICPEKRREIELALEKYEIDIEKKLDGAFNILQQYSSQVVWKISPQLDIQLEHYKDVAMDTDADKIDDELTRLRNAVIQQKKLHAILQYKHHTLQQDNQELDNYLLALYFLTEIPKQENVSNSTKDFQFIKDELDSIVPDIATLIQALNKEKAMGNTSHLSEMEQTERMRAKIDALLKRGDK